MAWVVLFLLSVVVFCAEGLLGDREHLAQAACQRNPNLSICKKEEEEITCGLTLVDKTSSIQYLRDICNAFCNQH
ncbi:hypothetical protein OESDEN_17022 [Oesophagostomum dentatum]|uniref:Uncharacterized protein n=1 Tax=Oesophagostomum dentatum TaxID=61180 RepID=A0A0B1SHB5_OESDE|nr:hypothetical protein OESDEN_17022 [Oesophagostomum dentatum]